MVIQIYKKDGSFLPFYKISVNLSLEMSDEPNFTGRSLTFTDVTVNKTYTERDYFSSFDFNDVTSSVEVKCF